MPWRPAAEKLALTVVCKATFALRPGVCPLNAEQEPVNLTDLYWDHDSLQSLYAPSDLVPVKAKIDVVLVGRACAPDDGALPSIRTRLRVGPVDKTIEVFGRRRFAPDGRLIAGRPIKRLSLWYERAGGGSGTWNPVGLSPDERDVQGCRVVPNLQPPGFVLRRPDDRVPPIGYGPIAPDWPSRQAKLGSSERCPESAAWADAPLPRDLDLSFFNAAPADQQIDELRLDQRFALDSLMPDHPRLRTRLPGLRPSAVVTRLAGGRAAVPLRADTLWIDTVHGICTVTWRGRFALATLEERGRVDVTLEPRRATGHDARRGPLGGARLSSNARGEASRAAEGLRPRLLALDDPDGGATEPFSPHGEEPTAPDGTGEGLEEKTLTLKGAIASSSPALPFRKPDPEPARTPSSPAAEHQPSPASPVAPAPVKPPVKPSPWAGSREGPSGPARSPASLAREGTSRPRRTSRELAVPRLEPWPSPAGHEEEGLWPTPRPPPLLGPLATPEMLAREAREQAGGEDERGRIGPPLDDAPPPGASDPALDEAVVDGADGAPSGEGAEVDGAAAAPDGPDLDDVGGVERSVPQEALAPQAASLPSEPEVEPSASDAEPLEPEAAASDPGAAPAEPEPLEPEAAASDLGAAPSEPPSIDLELFTVERSAVVRAALDCRPDDASQILEDHQLEPSHLRAIEAHWQAQIRAETRRGKSDLLRRRDDAYVAQLEEERGPITADEFAALVIAAERGGAAAALERLRLPSGASLPIERVFLRRVTDDPRLREQIRFAIEEARRQ